MANQWAMVDICIQLHVKLGSLEGQTIYMDLVLYIKMDMSKTWASLLTQI